jgi:prevent-host-death family protein
MVRLDTAKAQRMFADTIKRVSRKGERIMLRHRGKDVAALVTVEDFRRLRKLIDAEEDRRDARAARRTLHRIRSGEESTVAWKRVKAEAGL